MTRHLLLVLAFFSHHLFALEYPKNPDLELTPGSLCDRPSTHRYPEKIPYCERNVSTKLKNEIFQNYRDELGFRLDLRNRSNYKIDHYIPLCAGGSNKQNNLWPQHITVFEITDPLESVGCVKLSAAKITQAELIKLIRKAKLNLAEAPSVLKYLQSI